MLQYFQEGDDTILVRVVPAKSSRPPGRIKMNFEDMEKNREEELKRKAEEEKNKRYDENRRSFRESKRRSVVLQVLKNDELNSFVRIRFNKILFCFFLTLLYSVTHLAAGRRRREAFREGAGDSWKAEDDI